MQIFAVPGFFCGLLSLLQLSVDSKAVGEQHKPQQSQGRTAEEKVCVLAGPGGACVSEGVCRHAESVQSHDEYP